MDIARTGGAVRRARLRLPEVTLERLWSIAPVVAAFCAVANTRIALGDFWWHLKAGEMIATTGSIPTTDTFSFVTYGQPYLYAQWLGEFCLYRLFDLGGLELVVFGNAVVVAAVAACVLLACREATADFRAAALAALLAFLLVKPSVDARPQIFGILFFAASYLILIRYSQGNSSPLCLLPALAALWANTHGTAILSLALAGLFFGAEGLKLLLGGRWGRPLPARRVVALGVATAAAPLAMVINPAGFGFFTYVLGLQSNPAVRGMVTEWMPPTISNPEHALFFLTLFALVVLLAVSRATLDVTEVVVLVAFLALGFQAYRNLAWFGMAAAPIMARLLAEVFSRWFARAISPTAEAMERASRQPGRLGSAVAVLLAGVCVMLLPWVSPRLLGVDADRLLTARETPTGAVEYVRDHLRGERIFAPVTYAGYMAWAIPGQRIFVDGRVEQYPLEVLLDYQYIVSAVSWRETLAKYDMGYVIVPKVGADSLHLRSLRRALESLSPSEAWRLVYEDEKSRIYARPTSVGQ